MLRSIFSGAGVEHSSKSDQDYLLYVKTNFRKYMFIFSDKATELLTPKK